MITYERPQTDGAPKVLVLIDRDDTVIVDVPDLNDPVDVRLLPGSIEGLRRLRALPAWLALVSNQGALARGTVTSSELADVHSALEAELRNEAGMWFDSIHVCPHHPTVSGQCGCRKPGTGLLREAAAVAGVGSDVAWMIGNSAGDVRAGLDFGARTILVASPDRRDTTPAGEVVAAANATPAEVAVVASLDEAAQLVADALDRVG